MALDLSTFVYLFLIITFNIYTVSCQNEPAEQSLYLSILQNVNNLAQNGKEQISNVEALSERVSQLVTNVNWRHIYKKAESDARIGSQGFADSLASWNVSQKCANQTGEFLANIPLDFNAYWVKQSKI